MLLYFVKNMLRKETNPENNTKTWTEAGKALKAA